MSLVDVSVDLEKITGYDSIPTVLDHYRAYDAEVEGRMVLECVVPGCHFRRRDPAEMWIHVHFSPKHGRSFGMTFDELCTMVAL